MALALLMGGKDSAGKGTVQQESAELMQIARSFFSGKKEDAAFQSWHRKMTQLHERGIDHAREVLIAMCNDSNPLHPRVEVVPGVKGLTIQVSPPRFSTAVSANAKLLGSAMAASGVYSDAHICDDFGVKVTQQRAYSPTKD